MEPADVSRYVDLPYFQEVRLEIDDEGDQFYTALHPELLGCRGQGATPEEAITSLREAREMYLAALVEAGLPVPQPIVLKPQRRSVRIVSVSEVLTEQVSAKTDGSTEKAPATVAVH